jgi:hypothetical protein
MTTGEENATVLLFVNAVILAIGFCIGWFAAKHRAKTERIAHTEKTNGPRGPHGV